MLNIAASYSVICMFMAAVENLFGCACVPWWWLTWLAFVIISFYGDCQNTEICQYYVMTHMTICRKLQIFMHSWFTYICM